MFFSVLSLFFSDHCDYVTLHILILFLTPTSSPFQDYEDFFLSKENNTVFAFLGLSSKAPLEVRNSK